MVLSMQRRAFIGGLLSLVAAEMVAEVIPFGRVWSFPKNIVVAKSIEEDITFGGRFKVGSTVTIRLPARYIKLMYPDGSTKTIPICPLTPSSTYLLMPGAVPIPAWDSAYPRR